MGFRRNMCTLDRVVRLTAGIVLIYVGFIATDIINNQPINIFLGIFGVINIFAASSSFCPLYVVAHIDTSKNKTE